MNTVTKEIELVPTSKNFIASGGYHAQFVDNDELSYDEVLEETARVIAPAITPEGLDAILRQTFKAIIAATLRDGKTRRVGDFFKVALVVHGNFDEPGDAFDATNHALELKIVPLKEFRRQPSSGDIRVFNRNAGPTVVISGVTSAGSGEAGVVVFGEDIVLTGERLELTDGTGDAPDTITLSYRARSKPGFLQVDAADVTVGNDGTRLVIPWSSSVGRLIRDNPESFDPSTNLPRGIMVGLRSRGGDATSKRQLHRGKAFFDRWLEAYPNDRGNFDRYRWGKV